MVYANYLSYSVFLLKVGGLYKVDESNNKVRYLGGYTPRIFFNSAIAFTWVSIICEIFRKGVFDFSANAIGYSFFAGFGCTLLRAIYYCINGNKCESLVQKMNATFRYETETLLNEKSMEPRLKMTNKLIRIWMFYVMIVSMLFTLYPFYTGMWKNRVLPLPMWVPYDLNVSPFYEITCAMQVGLLMIAGWLLGSMDVFFTAVLLLTAEQFKLLGWELKNVLFTNLILNGIPKAKVDIFQGQLNYNYCEGDRKCNETDLTVVYDLCDSQRFDENMVRHSKKLISFHQSLLQFCTDLEDFFSPLMLIVYSFFMCAALFLNFAIVLAANDMSIILQRFPVNFGIYLEMLFPCVIGHMLTTEAEKLQNELWEMPWYMCGKKFKTNYNFVLHRVNMPVTLTVGKISNLNLPLFLWAAKTINSYFIVLYQFYQSK